MSILRRTSLALFLLLAGLAPALANERIIRFISDAEVERNGDLLVTETIRVEAEGDQIKHGIFRDFPTNYTRPDGTRVRVGFDVLSVKLDGASEPFSTERVGNGERVRIGKADTMLSNGEYEYEIRYRTTRQIGFFADYDELYWNVTGNGWPFAIDMAEARIHLPEPVRFNQTSFYTGPQGASGKDARVVSEEPGTVVFRTTQVLPPNNGLTVAAAWPKGIVAPPDEPQRTHSWLGDNGPLVVAGLGLLAAFAYYFYAWRRAGRDPSRGTIIPLFAPPENMSAAAVRYVRRMDFDERCFTAAIVDLGVHGHLKLTEGESIMTVERRSNGKLIAGAELATEDKLFSGGRTALTLIQKNHEVISEAKDTLAERLSNAYEGKLFHDHYGWSLAGALLCLAVIGLTILSIGMAWGADEAGAFFMGMLFVGPVALVISYLVYAGLLRTIKHLGSLVFVAVFILFLATKVGDAFNADDIFEVVQSTLGLLPLVMPLILFPLAASAFNWMKAHTVHGRKVVDQIEGFRQYLGVAEEARLEALNPPNKTQELFERFLPYAIALDVENHWAKRFAGVLAAAAAAGATSSWYSGSSDWSGNPTGLAHHLGSGLTSTISSAATAPGSSSGSGGGGFSGGGGGGGGGGGW
ncbi:MAG: DUF2207 domain-containing protein [Xanthobacteraceae bacterium]|nr:DUF2207 domain-containing protein [Xanthobacteraceae bacterium]